MAHDPFLDELVISEHGVEPVGLSELLSKSDFISMHLPATPEAVGFLKEHHFRQMKKTAIFINTGRGPTVVESALIKALQDGWIAGAGLDVFQVEPVKRDNPLIKMPHVILSPHNASASARFDEGRRRRVGRELALVLSGRWPMSCVNPTVLPQQRPAPVAAGVDAARSEFVIEAFPLMPAKAGIQCLAKELGPRVRGDERR